MGNNLTHEQRNQLESEIRAALMALDHYRKALVYEKLIQYIVPSNFPVDGTYEHVTYL